MIYFVIENQTRGDGIVNTSTVSRSSFSAALSYYYERLSKAAVTELYTSVSVMMVDKDLTVINQATIVPNAEA